MSVSAFTNNIEHEHDEEMEYDLVWGIPKSTKKVINELFDSGVTKPMIIMYQLRKQNIEEPAIKQLNNYISAFKKNKSKSEISYYDMEVWCSKRCAIPDDIHQVFVIGYVIIIDEDDPKKSIFRIALSTRFLLELALKTRHLAADATYKLNFHGCPDFLIGVNDMRRVFHSTALSLCSGETGEDYAFIFSSVKLIIDKIFFNNISTYYSTILIADGAEAITNGFITAFLVCVIRIMCWAHVVRAVDKRLNVTGIKEFKDVLVDIYSLQLSFSPVYFVYASNLFLNKWRLKNLDVINEFIVYFKSEWLKTNSGWHEGICH
jgi:hypothetical protein